MKRRFILCFCLIATFMFSACSTGTADSHSVVPETISTSSASEPAEEVTAEPEENSGEGSTVYMTTDISPEGLMAVYKALER